MLYERETHINKCNTLGHQHEIDKAGNYPSDIFGTDLFPIEDYKMRGGALVFFFPFCHSPGQCIQFAIVVKCHSGSYIERTLNMCSCIQHTHAYNNEIIIIKQAANELNPNAKESQLDGRNNVNFSFRQLFSVQQNDHCTLEH